MTKFNYEEAYKIYLDNLKKGIDNKQRAVREWCQSTSTPELPGYRSMLQSYIVKQGVVDTPAINVGDGHTAKVLVFDIETAPLKSFIWGVWNQNVGNNLGMVEYDWFMLTFSAKWLLEDKIYSFKLTPEEAIKQDDSRIVKELWKMVDEADVVIAHNAKKFDIKKMNTRFILNGLHEPSKYEVIDTLIHARRKFSMTSNKLDFLADKLGVSRKVQHEGFELWKKCYEGDSEALTKMSEYNDGDIICLEEVYMAMRGWISPHPNLGFHVFNDIESCPTCGSEDLSWNVGGKGVYRTYVNEYQTCRCNNCGSQARRRKAITTKSTKERLLVSLPTN